MQVPFSLFGLLCLKRAESNATKNLSSCTGFVVFFILFKVNQRMNERRVLLLLISVQDRCLEGAIRALATYRFHNNKQE